MPTVVYNSFPKRCFGALKGALLAPIAVAALGLASPFLAYIIPWERSPGWGGAFEAILLGAAVVSGIGLLGALLFGGPVLLGWLITVISFGGALFGYKFSIDTKATKLLRERARAIPVPAASF